MLIATSIGMLVATLELYRSQSAQQALLATSIRTSGWVAYQAELEFVNTHMALEIARVIPGDAQLADLSLRMEILLSRLPILYDSEEGRMIAQIDLFKPRIQEIERLLETCLDQLQSLPPDAAARASAVSRWRDELEPYGPILKTMLRESVLFNEQIGERERQLAETPATIPVVLGFGSGGVLIMLLLLQLRRDRRALGEIRTARAAQQGLETSLKSLIDAVPAGIVLVRPGTREVLFANPRARSLIGSDGGHPDWAALTSAALAVSGETESDQGEDRKPLVLNRPDGRILSLLTVVRDMVWQAEPVKLIAMADLTKLRDTELQLVHASKLASLGEMASAIGHELNQPLSVIRLAAENALRGLDRSIGRDVTASKLVRIVGQVERAQRITDQIRRYGRLPSSQNQHFPLRPALDLAIGFVANQYRLAGIALLGSFDLPAGIEVSGDQTMFEQVIVNLLVNSKDAFAEGPRRSSAPLTVHVSAKIEGSVVAISVSDNAGGIAQIVLDRLFQPLVTTKPAEKGTGLGLALARKIVRDMAGEIVGGNRDDGATFVITVPFQIPDCAAPGGPS